MLKRMRKNKKGFTLAELLIVVAIIGVLVAISIPIFTSQLEKSRDAVSISNIRAAYAEATSQYLVDQNSKTAITTGKVTVTPADKTAKVTGVVFKGTAKGWSNLDQELTFTHTTLTEDLGGTAGTYALTFTYADDGSVTLSKVE